MASPRHQVKMNKIAGWLIFVSSMFSTGLNAQDAALSESEEVLKVFHLFFDSMNKRDTVTIKQIKHGFPLNQIFFWTSAGNDQRLQSGSGGTFDGFIKTVGSNDGRIGLCSNRFEDFDVRIYGRSAVVSAMYTCFVDETKNNHGMYTIQMVKSDRWRILQVFRFVKTENEYFPEAELQDGVFKCTGINWSFPIPDGWDVVDKVELFTLGKGPSKAVAINDSLIVKSRLLAAIKKVNEQERIYAYITEPKYGEHAFDELATAYRLAEIKHVQSKLDGGKVRGVDRFKHSIEKKSINGIEFLVTSQRRYLDSGDYIENLSFDTIINSCLLSIEGIMRGEDSRNEILLVVRQNKFELK